MAKHATTEERSFEGIPVSPGIAIGKAHVLKRSGMANVSEYDIAPDEIEGEVNRFTKAIELSRKQLAKIRSQVAEAIDETHADIFGAQAMFLEDVELVENTVAAIRREKKNAEFLFNRRVNEFLAKLQPFDDEFMKAFDSDVLDISNRVLANLSQTGGHTPAALGADAVIVANDLAPSETTRLVKEHVAAFVLEKGGPTSHTAIMAKALEIPSVVGVANIAGFVENDSTIIVDGLSGRVVVNPTPETLRRFEHEKVEFGQYEKELEQLRDQDAETQDGYAISLCANLELPEEIAHVTQHGAQGIGLFRTEFLYMNRRTAPTEDEQFEIYRRAIEAVKPHCVVFRTLDIGGDKFFSAVEVSTEMNPFMGQRAIRLCLQHPEVFRDQLRAMLRASAFGRTRILIPMISGLEEFLEVKRQVRQAKEELKQAKMVFDPNTEVGAMIEVPSAAVVADALAHECDFFSIGTNDLIQYTLAVDRGNEKVAYLYEPLHPAIMRMMKSIISAGRDNGIPVAVCGEMAADPMMAIILLGMGVDELSMSAVCIPPVKKLIRSIDLSEAKALAEEILTQPTIEGAKQVLRRRMKTYISKNKLRKNQL
ncbi:MAG: phosphoenolpyruvate--protein phosphotransferase, partial [Candidatus Sumerlaeaceae bacterium]|nr:phosphoenolpyruvate--protein phosphotransferase [Candidatus Sumerlaeaceae bacterium]